MSAAKKSEPEVYSAMWRETLMECSKSLLIDLLENQGRAAISAGRYLHQRRKRVPTFIVEGVLERLGLTTETLDQ